MIKTSLDYKILADQTGGYSGSDLKLVSKEAAMRVLRKIFMILEHHQNEDVSQEKILSTFWSNLKLRRNYLNFHLIQLLLKMFWMF